MDDRQYAFLARQPSAALHARDRFWGMPKRGLAFLLANVMFWQPMWAQADGIVVSAPGTGLSQAGNGVPIVNIAKPNGSGLSHNQFSDYNVGSNGVILNNATARTQSTQLGGIIIGNPNLNGTAATTILNEVNGGNPSQLRGYTEVAGQSARVIVANPYGITCNGCGFINTPKATLTTGKPIIENGQVSRYQVDQGSVAIEGAGLNANNVDSFEIITRSAKINAEIQAKNLTIVTGRNDVNADTLSATARADDGSAKPQLAIDSSALGGMYAGAIKLVGTEAGVGVKLDGKLIASGGDIQLDANGHLSLAQTSATGTINVKAASLDAQGPVYAGTTLNAQTQGNLSNQQSLAARDSVTLNADGQLTNNGIIEAGVNADNTRNTTGDVSLTAQSLNNNGQSVVASRNLTANVAQTLSNQGGTLSGGQTTTVNAATLDNQSKGRVLSSNTLNITANTLLNTQGTVSSNGNLTANVGQLNNTSGEFTGLNGVTLRVASLDNVAGLVAAGQGLDINASSQVNNRSGRITSSKSVQLSAASMDNTAGRLLSDGALTASISAQLLNQAGLLSSAGLLTLNAASLDNRQSGVVTTSQAASLTVGTLDNRGGELSSQGALALTGTELNNGNSGKLIAYDDLRLTLERLTNQSQGLISTRGALAVNAGQLDNRQGSLYARQGMNLDLRGQLLNAQGSLKSDTSASVKAAGINNDAGQLTSVGALNIDSAASLSNLGGSVISGDTLALKAGQVSNTSGRIASAKALNASVTGLEQQNGQLVSNTSLTLDLNHGQLNNQGGLISTPGALLLNNLAAVNNRDGEISSDKAFSLNANSLDNSAGKVVSKQGLNLTIAQALNNAQGLVSANGLAVRAASLDNSSGTLSSDADLSVNVDATLTNLEGEVSSAGLTRLNAMTLNNRNGQVLGDNALNISLGGALDNREGVLGSGKVVDIQAASLNNGNAGQVISDGSLSARISGLLDNQSQGEVTAKGALSLQTGSLDNRGGRLTGVDLLTVRSDSLDNRGGNIRADKALQLAVAQLDNRNNGIITGKAGVGVEVTRLDNSGGLLSSVGPLNLKANEVQNALGRISSQTDLTALIDTLQQQGGALVSQGNLSLTGSVLDNRNGGLVGTTKALDLQVGQVDNRAGELSAGLDVKVGGQRLDNSDGGKLIAGSALELKVAQLINQTKGLIHAQGRLTLTGSTLDNSGGALSSLNALVITLDNALLNNKGLISSEGELTVNAGSLDNAAGSLGSAGALSIVSQGGLINQGGSISTDAGLSLKSASLDNSQKGLISSSAATEVRTGAFNNSQGGRLTSGNTLKLTAAQVNNAAGRIASSQALSASVTGLDQQQGELFSNTSVSLDMNQGQLNNQGGLINAPGLLLLSNLKDVNNQGGEISSRLAFTLAARNLDNSGGKLLSNQGLVLRTAQALNNAKGIISAASVDSHSASLDNSDGLVSSLDQLDLNVDALLDNQRGSLIADGALTLNADRLDNRAASIAGKAGLNVTVTALDNRQGTLVSTTDLTLKASSLDNRQAGLIGATKVLDLNVDDLDNRGGELSGNTGVTLVSKNLDNSDSGQIFAGQSLKLTVDKLLNRTKGLLSAKTQLSLDGGSLDNSGGYLVSQQNQRIDLSGDLINTQGQLSSEGTLDVSAANLSNSGGSLSSAANLTVKSLGRLDNQGGELVTDGALSLSGTALDNRQQGSISGKGAVNVTTGAFDNSQSGRLNSGSTLNLKAAQVTNQGGGRIGSQGALTASVSGLDQQGGQLFSNTSLSLDLNNGQLNNQNGLINAPGTLLLKNLLGVNNQGGEISSAQAFTLAAQNLTNDGGRLLSNQGLTLRIAQALNNVKGLIGAATVDAHAQSLNNNGGVLTSRGNLVLAIDQQLDNQAQGLISAAQLLTLNSGDLNNQGGSVLASGALLLNAMALNNSANGLINAQGDLTLTANALDSSDGGEVSAKGDMNLTLAALTQNGGRLLGEQAMALNLGGHDLNNRNGLITAKGPLTFNGLRNLNNQGGEISSSQSFTLSGQTLDNSGGKLISSQSLSLKGDSLVNQNGLISGWQDLQVSGSSLDNRNNGTLSSRNGDVGVTLSGALLNSAAGALVGQKKLTVSAASLDNRGGILSSGGDQILTVTGGSLNNAQGGLIDSGAILVMKAMTLGNAGGTVNAQQALSFTGTSLDNSGGNLIGNAAVTLDLLGALTNTTGKIASAGPLRVERATQINNQGGQIASQGLLTLLTGGLDNRNRGTVAANDQLIMNTAGAVQNDADGLIYSQNGGVEIDAASLTNGKGVVQSQGGLKLTVDADIDNQSGRIQAKTGDVTVVGRNLDNRGGVLASVQGLLATQLSGVLKNGYDLNNNRQGGITQAQRLNLIALGGLDNYGGRISAQTGDATVTTRNFDNRNGGLYAKGKVNVSGNDFDNSGDNDGQIAGSQIDLNLTGALNNRLGIIESDSTLAIKAASLDNQTGQLRALGGSGTTNFQIGGLFDNRNGTLETANNGLILNAANFQNQGGSLLHVGSGNFDISTANLTNAGGSLVTRGGLTLTADSWTNSSVIQAGRLTVNVNNLTQTGTGQLLASTSLVGNGGNWSNDGLIASDGSISLALGGSYGGSGRMSSLGGIDLTAAQLNLGAVSSIAGGGDTTVNIGGQLTNAGRLTSSANLTVQAGNLINSGTLGSARNLVLKTPSLLNDRGLVFSGADMTLGVSNFTNQSGDLYGLGNVLMGGYGGAARAASVNNVSGSMESGGTFTINADGFQNRTEGAVASGGRKLISGFIANICNDCKGDYYTFTLAAREVFESVDNDTSASALLTAGKDFVFQGSSFLNSKSTVSAGGNINIVADNVQNIGAQNGTIERTRMYQVAGMSDGGTGRFFANVLTPYNQRNNPDFPYVYYLDLDGNIHKAIPKSTRYREGGRDGESFSVVALTDVDTGATVKTRGDYNLVLPGLSYGFENTTQSQYDPNNLLQMPNLDQYNLLSDIEIVKDSSGAASTVGSRNAVIQAGGNVSITATKDLQNSVIHEDYAASGGTNKVADTKASGTGTTVVRINNQLPPDRAQQQVNPLSLPGFALPSGQNGLFRLSGQGGSTQQATQASTGSQNWSMGSASISTRQRQQDLPDAQARDVQVGAIAAVGTSDRQLALIARQANDSNVSASTLNVSAPVEGSHSLPMPSRNGDVGAGTQVAAVNVTGTNLLPTAQVVPQVGNAVDTPAASQAVVRVQGVPETSFKSNPQKYLIETNPVLTDLKSFMSSDYLLQNLGYDPDQSAKRLGDGLYEQRLIQQAVVARTGQRFIDGQTSDEGLFKYLMNNAIASKQELGLSVGVTLTSEQVAALTHDIVWLEEHEVNGEKVLVPVLYLAQAEGRLGPTGALIAGNDVTLIAGQNLDNVGTLRAANNLSATAGNDLVNSGLIQAGNRLDLLAVNNIANQAGGILAGRDVNIKAVMGDVVNERTVTTANYSRRQDFMDSAARIEAANDLDMGAGRDIKSVGSVMVSGRDTTIDAGRDAIIVSAQQESASNNGVRKSAVTQFGSSAQAGRDLVVNAGRDLNAIASQLGAERNVALTAGENMTISSAADETHSYSKTKKVTIQEDHVKQIGSAITAGGDVTMGAGKDMAIISSRISAGDEAYLVAGENLDVLAAQDSDYSLYDKKKKGSWGKKKTKHDEVTKVTNVGSEITAGGDLTLVSGDDQRYQAAKLNSGGDLTVQSGGAITFEGVKDLVQETHTKSNGDAFWTSSKGKGNTDETLRQTQMVAKGNIVIKAVDGLQIDVKQVNQQTVSQAIDAMVKADPQLAWLKQAEARGDVDWRLVKEIHQSFKYENSGLGPASQMIIAIVMAAVVGPAALSAFASLGTIGSAGLAAIATGAATNATTSFINNGGNLGAVFQDVTSSDALKGYVISGVTAGLTAGVFDGMLKTTTNPITGKVTVDLSSLEGVGRFAGNQILQGETSALLGKALGQGGSGSDALKGALFNTLAAASFNAVGDYTKGIIDDGSLQKIALHAMVGGLLAKATGGDFKTGALAAGANEALVADLDNLVKGNENLLTMSSQIVGILAATAQKDVDSSTLEKAAWIAKNASQYNRQLHKEDRELAKQLAARSGGKYTAEQIEEQLRLSNVEGTDIHAGDIVATKDGIYDPSAKWVDLGNGQFVQQLAKPDLDLIAYIRASASNYTWAAFPAAPDYDWSKTPNVSDEVRDRLSGRVLDAQGGFRSPVLVDGEAFNPRFLPCGDASCVASGAAIDLKDPETQRWISAGDAKAAKDALAVGSLVPLPMAWVGKVLGSIFGKGVASEAIGGGSSAVVTKGLGEVGGAKGVGNTATYAADDIRFSQNTVSFNKTDRISGTNYTYDDLVQSMKTDGWKGDPVDVVKMPDGKLTSMDNTRIAAAREAGIAVNASVRGFDDPLTPVIQKARGWESFSTWGEAISSRINKQSGGFSSSNPYGSSDLPRVTGGGR
ncbi:MULTISPECIES: filamentous hemagglutinin N-terminal domain-containing protein [unclassified Pseudomonas]|uniref:two-partner secretion domain-containing protein n=1 Tax=unclassified Pseudomonas TaxID=196821 RepID=UPI00087176AE|nr:MULTISPECIES: filamentous hemagglutinin N-terminal domain-containing protein [unclassified Pseudomonas]SCW99140.1 filamentous hemagglutinin [Pseudomonas sp. NFACC56-3]SFK93349.1 filamentous hemagglutinin [Pseudomonas sp. NFACC52]